MMKERLLLSTVLNLRIAVGYRARTFDWDQPSMIVEMKGMQYCEKIGCAEFALDND